MREPASQGQHQISNPDAVASIKAGNPKLSKPTAAAMEQKRQAASLGWNKRRGLIPARVQSGGAAAGEGGG